MRDIYILEAPSTGSGLLLVKAVLDCGYTPVFVTQGYDKYRSDIYFHTLDTIEKISHEDYAHRKSSINPHTTALILSGSDTFSAAAAEDASLLLGLEYGRPFIESANNKLMFRRIMEKIGYGHVRARAIGSKAHALEFLKEHGACIIKPVKGTGSIGVRLCREAHDVTRYFLERKDNDAEFMCEEFIEGPLYSAEVLVNKTDFKIIGYNDRQLSAPPFFNETAHSYPVSLPKDISTEISHILESYLKETGPYCGAAHIEFLLEEDHIRIVEINPRIGGLFIPEMMKRCHGVNPYTWVIESLLNNTLPTPHVLMYASAMYLYADKVGEIVTLNAGPLIENHTLTHASKKLNVGSRVPYVGDFRSLVLQVFHVGENPNIVFNKVNNAMNRVHMEIA